jgi:hypothetical protein
MSFKLNYILDPQSQNSQQHRREHLLFAMRQMMLSGDTAPMNTDLFYDQFLNPATLNDYGQQILNRAKQAWGREFKEFTCFLDYGISDESLSLLNSIQGIKDARVSLKFMDYFTQHVNVHSLTHSVEQYLRGRNDSPGVLKVAQTAADNYMQENPLHEHLPSHFSTYYDESLHQLDTGKGVPLDMSRVILESPFAGDIPRNTEYAARCVVDLMMHHHKAPMASHLLYTRVLNDHVPEERQIGIDAGLAYGAHANESVIAVDRGVSRGMVYGVQRAEQDGRALSFHTLSTDPQVQQDVRGLRDLNDLNAWVAQQQSKVAPTLLEKGWLTDVAPIVENMSHHPSLKPKL